MNTTTFGFNSKVDTNILILLKKIASERGIKYTPQIRGNARPIYFWTINKSLEGWWFNYEELEFYNLCKKLKLIK